MIDMPMCWKCSDAKLEKRTGIATSYTLKGCKRRKKIRDYDDAKKLCPLIGKEK